MASDRKTWQLAAAVIAALCISYFPFVRHTRVPLLWAADLGFHELGHMVTIFMPEKLMFIMGSGLQILVPLGLATYFYVRLGDLSATGLMLAWTGASMWDVSVYIADAPFQRLPLIGGTHDWAYLLGRRGWDMMSQADEIARATAAAGLIVAAAGIIIASLPLVVRFNSSRSNTHVPRGGPVRHVRDPRRFRNEAGGP